MNQIEALQQLNATGMAVLETRDAAALLQVSASNATTILRRLAHEKLIVHLSYGRWLIARKTDRLWLPELISAPSPAYVSLQSALYHHGVIEQIPAMIYAVTLGRTRRFETPVGLIRPSVSGSWTFAFVCRSTRVNVTGPFSMVTGPAVSRRRPITPSARVHRGAYPSATPSSLR